jgi:hypothetical protein
LWKGNNLHLECYHRPNPSQPQIQENFNRGYNLRPGNPNPLQESDAQQRFRLAIYLAGMTGKRTWDGWSGPVWSVT